MVTGNTGDNILVTGEYYCQHHPSVSSRFVQQDRFPHCHLENHETIWELKDTVHEKNHDPSNNTSGQPGKTNGANANYLNR